MMKNQITLSGLGLVAANVLTLLYYDPYYKGEMGGASGPPQWIYFTCVMYSPNPVRVVLRIFWILDGPRDYSSTRLLMLVMGKIFPSSIGRPQDLFWISLQKAG